MILKTTCGTEFEINDEDYCLFPIGCKFSLNKTGITYWNKILKKNFSVSRVVMRIPEDNGMDVDHWDRNLLNTKKVNLRICTRSENCANKRIQKNNTSGYKGVTFDKRRKYWVSRIKKDRIYIHIGVFKDKILAALAYDDKAIELFGKYSSLNFPLYGA